MRFKITLLLSMILLSCTALQAQSDTLIMDSTGVRSKPFVKGFSAKWNMQPHSPLQATVRSLVIPGWGQIYNARKKEGSILKYWKAPVVWVSIATCVAFIDYNNRQYQHFKQDYIYQVDGDPTTTPSVDYSNLNELQDFYHRMRDISYFALAGVYILQALEANVDAHLFYFDVSDDLTLEWTPLALPTNEGRMQPGIGISLHF